MKISTILDQIDMGRINLPEFQRGYVWNKKQVKSLVESLYKGYPIGSLLVWSAPSRTVDVRGADGSSSEAPVELLLDGQQRVTSLYGLVQGMPPILFQGNADAFQNLYFHVERQEFVFHQPLKM